VALGLGVVALTRGAPPVPSLAPSVRTPITESAAKAPSLAVPPLTRNPFEYADAPRASASGALRGEAPGLVAEPARAPVARLSGFLRQAGRLRVALVLNDEMALLEVGESAEGYTLLAADEETGVLLRGPGGEIVLTPEQ
jgi:hypothetical protein